MPEPRTLDNPNDIAIREQQAQQRLAMAKQEPRGTEIDAAPRVYGDPFTFRFRQVKNGSFNGLWELAAMKPNGKVEEIITDADALPYVLEMIGNIFANRGY